jgi:hypothetical protein
LVTAYKSERDKQVNRRNFVMRSFIKSASFTNYYYSHKIKKDEIDKAKEIREAYEAM